MMNIDKSGSVLPFLLGAGVGALAALLIAPKSGADLRSDIAEGVSEGGRQLRAHGQDLKQRVQKVATQAQDQAREAIDAGQEAYTRAKNA